MNAKYLGERVKAFDGMTGVVRGVWAGTFQTCEPYALIYCDDGSFRDYYIDEIELFDKKTITPLPLPG